MSTYNLWLYILLKKETTNNLLSDQTLKKTAKNIKNQNIYKFNNVWLHNYLTNAIISYKNNANIFYYLKL